jgi:hypothetical protein
MAPGIGASGIMGIALEAVSGTYVAPTKFVPFDSESLMYQQDTVWRRPIRNTPGITGAIGGNAHVAGDISMDALADVIPYFLLAGRTSVQKTGAGPYVYTFVPTPGAIPTRTLSITIVKNGVVFAYTGVVVNTFQLTTDNGILKFNVGLIGRDEATQSVPTPTWPTTEPFGAGSYEILFGGPDPSDQIFDVDTFDFSVDNGGEPQFRLKNTGRGAQFIKYGEMAATLSMERDFESRADYDAYKALTQNEVHLNCVNGAEEISVNLSTAIADSYEVALGGQGDLVRASVSYQCVINAAGETYEIEITTAEDIAVV